MARSKTRRPWLDYLAYLASASWSRSPRCSRSSNRMPGAVPGLGDLQGRWAAPQGWDRNLTQAFGDRFTTASAPDRPRGVSPLLHDAHGDPPHAPQASPEELARPGRAGRARALMDQLMSGDRPLIVLTGHYGNWELAGYVFGMFGFPTVSVARSLDNPYLERYLRSFRERTGQSLIPKTGGFDQMVEVLEHNRCADVSGRPGRRPARALCRLFRSARLDPQGDRAARQSNTRHTLPSASRGGSGRASATRSVAKT